MTDQPATRFVYTADVEHRLIQVVAHQSLTRDDLMMVIDRQLAEGRWSFGVLYDLSRIDHLAARSDAAAVIERVKHLVAEHGPRGPVALVTTKADAVGTGQVYAFRAKGVMLVDIFWDIQDAQEWLTEHVLRATVRSGRPAPVGPASEIPILDDTSNLQDSTSLAQRRQPPIHPGQCFLEDFLGGGVHGRQVEAARGLGWSVNKVNAFVNAGRSLTADDALELADYTQTAPSCG